MNYQTKWKVRFSTILISCFFYGLAAQDCPDYIDIVDNNDDCMEHLLLYANGDNNCDSSDYFWEIDYNDDGDIDQSGIGLEVETLFPIGLHRVTFMGGSCEPAFSCSYPFEVIDDYLQTPFCIDNAVVNTPPFGNITLWAFDFVNENPNECTSFNYTINHVPIVDDVPQLLDAPNGDTSLQLPCWEFLGENLFQIWAIDELGNYQYCTLTIFVADPLGICDPVEYFYSGNISCFNDLPIEGIAVGNWETDENGNFQIITLDQTTSIQPTFDDTSIYELDVYDIYLWQIHNLEIINLDPYQLIAADVDNNGYLSAFDIVFQLRLIRGIATLVEGWKFVDANYVFPDPTQPFGFPESVEINAPNQIDINFKGIKLGDISAGCGQAVEADENLLLSIDTTIIDNDSLLIKVYCENCIDIIGLQFDLAFDDNLSFVHLLPIDLQQVTDAIPNRLTAIFHDVFPFDFDPNEPIFEAVFIGDISNLPDDFVQIKTDRIKAAAYKEDGYLLSTQNESLINCPSVVEGFDEDGDCVEEIELLIEVYENCILADYTWSIDFDSNSTIDLTGNGIDASGSYPIGNHRIHFNNEICGTSCNYLFEIKDIKKPTAIPVEGLALPLEIPAITFVIPVTAAEMNDGSFDECSAPLSFQANIVDIVNGNPILLQTPPEQGTIFFTCNHLGENLIQFWAIDEVGNYDYTTFSLFVNDPNNYCNPVSTKALDKKESIFSANYPNPFVDQTSFEFSLDEKATVSLYIFNTIGKKIYMTKNQYQRGDHILHLPATIFDAEGIYYYQFFWKNRSQSGIMNFYN